MDAFRPGPQPRILIPHQLSNNLELISEPFQLWRQQDAHEYLVLLFGKLDACDPNLVKQIFGGYLLIRHKCMRCGGTEETNVVFNHFTLSRLQKSEVLDALTSEYLVPIERFHRDCTPCNGLVECEKLTLVGKSPEVLILHVVGLHGTVVAKKLPVT
ncbi:hypothetical protein RYX36_017206 [Vicia faba]